MTISLLLLLLWLLLLAVVAVVVVVVIVVVVVVALNDARKFVSFFVKLYDMLKVTASMKSTASSVQLLSGSMPANYVSSTHTDTD